MIKINSELPLTMLDMNLELNDYDFVLFHLYQQYPAYREYYKNLRRTHPTRLMILDNSAYEFFVKGEELDLTMFANAIIDLKPDFYILPDKLMDMEKTLELTRGFYDTFEKVIRDTTNNKSQPLAVAQGMVAADIFECLVIYLKEGIRNVALPFHNSFYTEYARESVEDMWRLHFGQLTEDDKYACGRVQLVRDLESLLSRFDHVHLLGSHNPWEKHYYDPEIIHTMDTGYPVKLAITGMELGEETSKPNIIIDDFMTTELTMKQKELIKININHFKNF